VRRCSRAARSRYVIRHRLRAPVVLALKLQRPIPLRDTLASRAEDVLRDRAAHRSQHSLIMRFVNVLRRITSVHRRIFPFRVEGIAVESVAGHFAQRLGLKVET
jgi:hypothetical protein